MNWIGAIDPTDLSHFPLTILSDYSVVVNFFIGSTYALKDFFSKVNFILETVIDKNRLCCGKIYNSIALKGKGMFWNCFRYF
jgi:hypothetical protein